MNVTLCSHFRNATAYLPRYFAQVGALQRCLDERGDRLELVLAEGDSTDDTWAWIYALSEDFNVDVERVDHGGKDYGSVVHPERFANIAKVCNAIWQRLPVDADAVVWMESDLIWRPATVLALLDHLAHVPAVAPCILLKREGWPENAFYDTWAFRKNGKRFGHYYPYNEWLSEDMMRVDSAGSCLAMRGDVARAVTWPSEDVIVGLCRQVYELGGSVWLDPNLQVTHL